MGPVPRLRDRRQLRPLLRILFAILGILTVAVSHPYLQKRGLREDEFHILIMASVIGMMVLGSATSLVTVFLGLELFSIALYIACGFIRTDSRSQEAAAKYLLVGGFASAFVLYGMALVYGASGTTLIPDIATRLTSSAAGNPLLVLGIVLMGVGFAFKVSAAPFGRRRPPGCAHPGHRLRPGAAPLAMIIRAPSRPTSAEWQALLALWAATASSSATFSPSRKQSQAAARYSASRRPATSSSA